MKFLRKYLFLLPSVVAVMMLGSAEVSLALSNKEAEKAGAVLFRDKGCAYCHGIAGKGTAKGPSLDDLRKKWKPAQITAQILNGGQRMPSFQESLTDDEVTQLVKYLRARHRPVPPPASETTSAPVSNPGQ